jgi:hypothetical protein
MAAQRELVRKRSGRKWLEPQRQELKQLERKRSNHECCTI